MLEFFRKYQRLFFIFITGVITVTFSFFGTYSGLVSSEQKIKDFVVARAIDGSSLYYQDVTQLAQLLGAESGSSGMFSYLLQTGVMQSLVSKIGLPFESEWQIRFQRLKRARYYQHPAAPGLSARSVWGQLAPNAMKEVALLEQEPEIPSDFFDRWCTIYLQQQAIPSEYVKRVLLYQQNQFHLPQDHYLLSEDCSLLGYHGPQDWFGKEALELAAQFVLNGAILAEQQGIRVGEGEAKGDLLKRLGRQVGQRNASSLKKSVRLWQKALGFLAYAHDTKHAVLLDDMPYRTVASFAKETAQIEAISLPKELQLATVEDLLDYEAYVKFSCVPVVEPWLFPEEQLSIEEVAKRAPDLLHTVYSVKVSTVDLKKIGSRISLREIWDWQTDEQNWSVIRSKFAMTGPCGSREERFFLIERMDPAQRAALNEWTRKELVLGQSSLIEQELDCAAQQQRQVIVLRDSLIGLDVQESEVMRLLLEQASREDISARAALAAYREEGADEVHRITDVQLIKAQSILSLAEAKKYGWKGRERFLEQEYQTYRLNTPSLFKDASGTWKSLDQVRELVIRRACSKLFADLDREEQVSSAEMGKRSLEEYVVCRFAPLMKRALAFRQNGATEPKGAIWQLNCEEKTCTRVFDKEEWIMQQPFRQQAGEWSPVYVPVNGNIVFFYLKERSISQEPVLPQILLAQETISMDVEKKLAGELCNLMIKNEAFAVPLRTGEDQHDDF